MANTKIKDLTEKATGVATDEFAINDVADSNADKKMGMDGLRITASQITDLTTKAEFDTALSDDDFAYIGQANVFTQDLTISKNIGGLNFIDTQGTNGAVLAFWQFKGDNSLNNETVFADLKIQSPDVTDGSEDGLYTLRVMQAGTLTKILDLRGDTGIFLLNSDVKIDATKKFFRDGGGDTFDQETAADNWLFQVGGQEGLRLTEVGTEVSVICGATNALATDATDGFLYIPTSAGAPTGTPTAKTGKVALEFDTTNNDLYVYDGSWIKVALA